MILCYILQDCQILSLDESYRSELFPRATDGGTIIVAINISILAFPKVIIICSVVG